MGCWRYDRQCNAIGTLISLNAEKFGFEIKILPCQTSAYDISWQMLEEQDIKKGHHVERAKKTTEA